MAGYSPLAEYSPLAGCSPLPGSSALAGTAGPAAPQERPPDAPAVVAPPLHKTTKTRQKYQDVSTRTIPQARPTGGSAKPRLTLGAALGAAPRSSARVRQAWLWHVPSRRDGRVVRNLDHGHFGFLFHSLRQGPEVKTRSKIRIYNNQDEM